MNSVLHNSKTLLYKYTHTSNTNSDIGRKNMLQVIKSPEYPCLLDIPFDTHTYSYTCTYTLNTHTNTALPIMITYSYNRRYIKQNQEVELVIYVYYQVHVLHIIYIFYMVLFPVVFLWYIVINMNGLSFDNTYTGTNEVSNINIIDVMHVTVTTLPPSMLPCCIVTYN